jgi:hypothetical protein
VCPIVCADPARIDHVGQIVFRVRENKIGVRHCVAPVREPGFLGRRNPATTTPPAVATEPGLHTTAGVRAAIDVFLEKTIGEKNARAVTQDRSDDDELGRRYPGHIS